jgi:hypothetical protein
MSGANLANLLIGVAVLALLLWRQLATRRLTESYRFSVILAILGILAFAHFLQGHPHDTGAIAAAVAGSLVLAGAFGWVRALTVRVWRQDGGQLLRKGTWLTALLWVITLAVHLGYDELVAGHVTSKNGGNVADATAVLYLVISLTVQRYALLRRVARQEAAGQVPVADQQVPLGSLCGLSGTGMPGMPTTTTRAAGWPGGCPGCRTRSGTRSTAPGRGRSG